MLSAKRDVSVSKRFFKKVMRANHRRLPFTVGTDKHASYLEAFATSVAETVLTFDCKMRRVKYLDNIIEQDHRTIKRKFRGPRGTFSLTLPGNSFRVQRAQSWKLRSSLASPL
jgi:transposase-like protein